MFIYRKLTYDQSVQTARHLLEHKNKHVLRDLLDDFYGSDTSLVDIEVEHGKYGDTVQNVFVFTLERKPILPDLTLPAWQNLLAEDDAVFDPHDKEEDQLNIVGSYMVQYHIYLDYGIDPREEEDLRIEAGFLPALPDLYVLEFSS